jgi:hypothetical protein
MTGATSRLARGALWRDILVIWALPIAVYVVLFWLSSSWYEVDLSGVPDEGSLPASFLPWFLFAYRSGGSINSDPTRLLVWVTACLAYLVPPAIASGSARDARTRVGAVVLIAGLTAWAVLSIPSPPPPSEGITYFTGEGVHRARAWLVCLGVMGVVAGQLIRLAIKGRRRWRVAAKRSSPTATGPV